MATTAKVSLARKNPIEADETDLVFTADYADGRNKEWAKYTPSLSLTMRVVNSVAENFELGQPFVLTFEPAND
jgi:hypothetical protein